MPARKNTQHVVAQTTSVPQVLTQKESSTGPAQSEHSRESDNNKPEQPGPVKRTRTASKHQPKEVVAITAVEMEPLVQAKKTKSVAKRQHEADTTTILELKQPVPAKKAKTAASQTKRQREADNADVVESEQAIPKKKKTTPTMKAIEAQQSPARRSVRNPPKVPAGTQRRKRRTKAEMAADKAMKEMEKKQLEELTEKNNRAMTRMDITEDINRAETAARTIRKFADLDHKTESDGEEFVGYNEVCSGEDSDSDNSHVEDTVKLKKANIALKKLLEAAQKKGGGSKKNGGGGKKLTKKVAFASGLLSDWNSRDDAVKEPPKKCSHVQISAGGLEDSDAEAVNPFSTDLLKTCKAVITENELKKGSQTAKRDLSRRNELVSIELTDDEADYIPHPAKKVSTKTTRPVQVKMEKRENNIALKTKTKRLNSNNVRVSDLPDFAQNKWRATFLPTLYDKFFTSDEPFDGFNKGCDQFIALLQTIFDEVFPGIDYEVTSSDSIHLLAYNRINEKRSNIGSSALNLVNKHLDTLGPEKARKDWLRWALRKDGPFFFKVPSPIGSPTDTKDTNYQFPEGRLLSKFIINLAAPFIGLKSGSASDNGYPRGLIALIMAALERAAVRSLLNTSAETKDFTKEVWGSKVETYYAGLDQKSIPDARWKELLDACGFRSGYGEELDDDDQLADLSMLDNNRALVFNFCSPAKSRD